MTGSRATLDRLKPGEHCRITETQWFGELEGCEPFHQWGSCFLVEDAAAPGGLWLWFRDPSGAGKHTAARLDPARSRRAREGVARVEQVSDRVADQLREAAERGSSSLDEHRAQGDASEAFTALADALYKELLTFGPPRPDSPPGDAGPGTGPGAGADTDPGAG